MEIKDNQGKADEITRENTKVSFEGVVLQNKGLASRYCIMHDSGKMQYLKTGENGQPTTAISWPSAE
ncbi:MAG: hypothetical protein WC001_03765 [Desulfurivibrionaceae bacterium]